MDYIYHTLVKRTLLFFILPFLTNVTSSAALEGHHGKEHGLHFYSYKEFQGKRTSLSLNDGDPFALSGQLDLQFNMLLRSNGDIYGDILNIFPDTGLPIRLSFIYDKGKTILALILNNKINRIAQFPADKWFDLRIKIRASENTIEMSLGKINRKFSLSLSQATKAKITFGYNDKISPSVPSINIRDIKVRQDNKLIRRWLLDKHNDSICYDQVEKSVAIAQNGMWLIDTHSRLTPIFSGEYDNPVEVAVDIRQGQFLVISKKQIERYDVRGSKMSTVPVNSESPRFNVGNGIVSPLDNTLMLYSIDDRAVSTFDSATGCWTTPEATQKENSYYNQSRAWNPADSSYYFFGGYGFFRYRNDLFRLDMRTQKVSKINYKPLLSPRYAATAAIHDNYLYILGGRGNSEGQQVLTISPYHTLNRINLNTGRQDQVWTIPDTLKEDISFAFATSMVYNEPTKSFYTVCVNKHKIFLMKFGIEKPEWSIVDRLQVKNEGYEIGELNLYDCPAQERILLVMNWKDTKNKSSVSVYSLSTPILTQADIQQDGNTSIFAGWRVKVVVWCIILLVALLLGRYSFRHLCAAWKAIASHSAGPLHPTALDKSLEQTTIADHTTQNESTEAESYSLMMPKVKHKSFIQLLGEFRVFDCNGNDITEQCTPKLKELLIVIIFNCEKEHSGRFPAERISEMLWPDKDEHAARNNRNVSLRKLRTFLEAVGEIEILGTNSIISINWHNVVCDYHEVLKAAKQLETGERSSLHTSHSTQNEESILGFLFSGALLPNYTAPWLDDFKSKFSLLSLDYLGDLLLEELKNDHTDNVIRISDVMLKHDPFSEKALTAKCRMLVRNNNRGMAKNVYESFCREYEKAMDEPFEFSFVDIIGNNGKY